MYIPMQTRTILFVLTVLIHSRKNSSVATRILAIKK